ncbi:hypothetical protein [Mucilaginibacter sp.]|uniref:hypothetical protein n=1 Tax=Mucilaginibacter sp. TaxID=1882438 RepID=UPI0025FFAD8C|nr:hypothetical protein [Mucilaginibacter sp.]
MIFILIITGALLIIIGIARKSAKKPSGKPVPAKAHVPQELVDIETTTSGNTTTFSVKLNENELKRRMENGTLNISEKREARVEDIAGFYGQQRKSPDGRFIVLAADSYELNGKNKKGQLALLNDKQLLFRVSLQRPNDAHVSNNGIVICCDWLNSEALTGKFLVFNNSGEVIFSKKTTANLGNCALSENGLFALFETYGSDTGHSNQIFIMDIAQRAILAQFERPYAFNTATIIEQQKQIILKNHKGFTFEIDFEGQQLKRGNYEKQILAKGSIYDKMILYEDKSEDEKFADAQYLQLLEKAVNDKDASYSFGVDKIYRKIGEYYEANNQFDKTIEFWEKAFALNPKIGISRKLENLKKKVALVTKR